MLKVPQLDDLTYEQRVKRAVSRIPAMTDQWTDFNSHDPGITVLQTYAWLTDMLNYYMNATGDVHVEKYLKLLGIQPEKAKAAECYVILENAGEDIKIPKGTSFYAGTVPFETEEDYQYIGNRFCTYIQETDGFGMDLTAFAGADGEYIEVFPEEYQEKAAAYFGFEKELHEGDCLYVSVKEETNRNPFEGELKLCKVMWEYYTPNGWKALEVQDETYGFLKSGFLKIINIEEMMLWQHPESLDNNYYIRCILKENAYDCMPKIGKIYVNPMKLVQKSTVCRCGEILPHMQIGSTNGCAGQEVIFDYPNIYCFSLLLFGEEGDEENGEIWTQVENVEEADYKDKVFSYDEEKRCVCFGDGIHGMVPQQNQRICVTGLEVSEFEMGNVLKGEINRSDCESLKDIKIFNPTQAAGGRKKESLPEMIERMEETLFVQNRMVSEEDYQRMVLNTPGLMLELAQVIPGWVYGDIYRKERDFNEVIVVVKPYSKELTPKLSATYKEMISQHIEKYRLLNTKVTIVSPVYVGVEVHARIMLQENTKQARDMVQQRIRELIEYHGKKRPFGETISYGKIFTSLEAMDEVKWLKELVLEKNGTGAVKNDRGDILCQQDALTYLEKMSIEFD